MSLRPIGWSKRYGRGDGRCRSGASSLKDSKRTHGSSTSRAVGDASTESWRRRHFGPEEFRWTIPCLTGLLVGSSLAPPTRTYVRPLSRALEAREAGPHGEALRRGGVGRLRRRDPGELRV